MRGFREEDQAGQDEAPQPADFDEDEPPPFRGSPPRGGIQERLARAGSVQPEPPAAETPDESEEFDDEWSIDDQAFEDEELEKAELPEWLSSIRSGEQPSSGAESAEFPEEPAQEAEADNADLGTLLPRSPGPAMRPLR